MYTDYKHFRLKPDIVIQPVKTARTFVHHYNSTQYCNTETVFFNTPFLPDQHHISDVAKWRYGGKGGSILQVK